MNMSNQNPGNKNDTGTTPVEKQDDVVKTPEDAVKEPLTPVPAIDEINPPLEAKLGGDDVVIPQEKKQ